MPLSVQSPFSSQAYDCKRIILPLQFQMKQPYIIPDKLVTTLFLINFPQAGYDESPVVLVDRWPRTKRAAASFQPVTRLHQTRVSGRHENSTKWLKRPFLLSVIWKRCLSTPEKETTVLSQKLLLLMINLATIPLQLSKSNYSTFQGWKFCLL